ncbi:MAG: TonB-dependent receptor [Hyphomonadaceae bacterium]
MFSRKLLSGAALTALSISMAGAAHAQSTASQIEEEEVIVVTGQRTSLEGTMLAEQAPRARATVTEDYIETQQSGQTILQSLNLIPGVQFDNNDAYGSSGGNLTIRGFDGARISLTFDGVPLNDTGNYAIYSNQQLDPELITRANVNMGTTEVDSPTASAVGGTVNYVTVRPDDDFGVIAQGTAGSENFGRLFLQLDTGHLLGETGPTAFGAVSYTEYDHFVGPGTIQKEQYNARIYQDLGDNGDFLSLSFHYNENRNNFYRGINLAQFNAGTVPVYSDTCTTVAGGPGAQAAANCGNYIGVRINPSNTGNIRGQGRFTLSDSLTLTVDPNYQFVRANGGGTESVSETNRRLGPGGVDLNGDGDTLDTVLLYSPSNTTTNRYGITSSLIWDINDNQRVRVGYTYDYGRHRQTGEYSTLNAMGDPSDVFGGREGFGPRFINNYGDIFQKRDRSSIASLSQWSAEYRGDFMDDRFTMVVGVRIPEFERELLQRCFAQAGSTSSTQFCTDSTPDVAPLLDPNIGLVSAGFVWFDLDGDGRIDSGSSDPDPLRRQSLEVYAAPFTATVNYSDVLPNVGFVYRPAENHQFFLSYAEGLSAPRTDDLYGGNTVTELQRVEPETSQAYDLGYRYQAGNMLAGATLWYNQFQNRIIRSVDPDDPTFAISRNVGAVDLWGAEIQAGWQPTEALTLYGSASYVMSELQNNLPGQVVGAGNELPGQANWTYAARAEYEMGPFTFGLQGKYVGERYANDFNSEVAPDYTVVDFDARWDLGTMLRNENTYLQLNVTNLLDEEYLGAITFFGVNNGTGSYALGAPQTVTLTLRAQF